MASILDLQGIHVVLQIGIDRAHSNTKDCGIDSIGEQSRSSCTQTILRSKKARVSIQSWGWLADFK